MVVTDNDIFSFSSLLHLLLPPRKNIWATGHLSICGEEGMSQNLAVSGRRGKKQHQVTIICLVFFWSVFKYLRDLNYLFHEGK